MKLFKNICAGTGLLTMAFGIVFFMMWLLWSIGKTGAVALAFSIASVVSYLKN